MQYALFTTVSLLWGVNFILMKYAVATYTPLGVAVIRVISGALFLGMIVIFRERRWPFSVSDIGPLSLVILLGYSWPFFIQPHLIQFCGSGVIGLMPALVPLITIVISVPLLSVKPTFRQLGGVLAGLGFIVLLLYDGIHRSMDPWHLVLAVTVPLSYAVSNTLVKKSFANITPVIFTFLCLAISSLLLTPVMLLEQQEAAVRMANSENFAIATLSAIWLGIFGTGTALLFFVVMLQQRGPLFAGMVTYIIPVIALAVGAMDGEHVSYSQIIALFGILTMVAIVQWPPKCKPSNKASENMEKSS